MDIDKLLNDARLAPAGDDIPPGAEGIPPGEKALLAEKLSAMANALSETRRLSSPPHATDDEKTINHVYAVEGATTIEARVMPWIRQQRFRSPPCQLPRNRTLPLSTLREDVPGPSLAMEPLLSSAPAAREGCFAVPRAIE